MKRRINILPLAIVVMLSTIILILLCGRKVTVVTAAAPVAIPDVQSIPLRAQTLPLLVQVEALPLQSAAISAGPTEMAKAVPPNLIPKAEYTAVEGDSLSNVVIGLLGTDTKSNRDRVLTANPELQADPDRVLAWKTYYRNIPETVAPSDQSANVPTTQPEIAGSDDRVLKYTAQPGDSVSALAAGLLGDDSKANRDAIVSENPSLKNDPDRVVAGKTYAIPTTDGLSNAPRPTDAHAAVPTTQPDSDQVVKAGEGRQLRYTALAGDTVSKLAKILLGEDSEENRNLIINSNPSLKADPDRVVAGQTYWIPAPSADADQR